MTPQTAAITAGFAVLIAWRIYSRMRRLIGRQQSRAWRHWTTVVVFPIIIVLFAITALMHPVSLAALACGLAAGIGLGIWGLRMTKFDPTPAGYFYTPSAHIGIALSLLLVARIGYRFYEVSMMTPEFAQNHMQDFGRSPLTLLCFGTLAGYYTTYAIGILRWRSTTKLPGAAPAPIPPAANEEVKP